MCDAYDRSMAVVRARLTLHDAIRALETATERHDPPSLRQARKDHVAACRRLVAKLTKRDCGDSLVS